MVHFQYSQQELDFDDTIGSFQLVKMQGHSPERARSSLVSKGQLEKKVILLEKTCYKICQHVKKWN